MISYGNLFKLNKSNVQCYREFMNTVSKYDNMVQNGADGKALITVMATATVAATTNKLDSLFSSVWRCAVISCYEIVSTLHNYITSLACI